MVTERELADQIEAIVDRETMENTLNALLQVCISKELHVEEDWQDKPLARRWKKLAIALDKLVDQAKGL